MKLALALAGLGLVSFALPAAADESYWVVQDVKSHHCQIVDQRPATHDMTIVGGDGLIYHTRVQAEDAMKTVKICHD